MKKLLFSVFTVVLMFIGGVGVLASDNLTIKEHDDIVNIVNESNQDIIITEGRLVDGKIVEEDYKMEGRTQRVKNKGDIATLTYKDEVVYIDQSIEADLMFKDKGSRVNHNSNRVIVKSNDDAQTIHNESNELITLVVKSTNDEGIKIREVRVPSFGKYEIENSTTKEEVYLNGVLLAENKESTSNRGNLTLIIIYSIIFLSSIATIIFIFNPYC